MSEPLASPETLRELLYQDDPAPEVWMGIKKRIHFTKPLKRVLGKTFKKFTVKSLAYIDDSSNMHVRCLHECGREKNVLITSLTGDKQVGCECTRRHAVKHSVDPRPQMLYAARKRAKKKDLPFNLTIEDIVIPEFCPVLGVELKVGTRQNKNCAPTLDRIKLELGYVKGNVLVISWRANSLKSDGTLNEMEKIVEYIRKTNA